MPDIEPNIAASELLETSMHINGCTRRHGKHCCEYHTGFEDGMDLLIERITRDERS